MSRLGLYDTETPQRAWLEPETQYRGLFDPEFNEVAAAAAAAPRPTLTVRLQAVTRGAAWMLLGILLRWES